MEEEEVARRTAEIDVASGFKHPCPETGGCSPGRIARK
jgi:hypothetical protein